MKALLDVAAVMALTALLSGCSDDVVQPDCQRTGTALVAFENHTAATTFNAMVDSTVLGSIAPGETVGRDVSAGQHTLSCCMPISADSCTSRTETLDACSQTTYDCVLPSCITGQTARITLVNDSSCCPFELYVDGLKVADLGPGARTDVLVSAGAVHPVEFRVGSDVYCSMNFVVSACYTYQLNCTRT